MIPVSLSLEGFLSYKDRVEIEFSSFDLACITGENGAGKSSILDGITWALFGRARKHDESVINLESSRAEVSLVFQYEANQYKITRSNPQGKTKEVDLYLLNDEDQNWIPISERTLRDTDQKIVEILRLDYDSFINASFLLQGEADQFTQQNPTARKKILSQILGLEIWETYRSRASSKRRDAEKELSLLNGRIQEITSELAEEEQRITQLKNLEDKLAAAQKERETAENHLSGLNTLLTALADQEKLVTAKIRQADKKEEAISQLEEKITERENERDQLQEIIAMAESIQAEYKDWEKAQESLVEWEEIAESFREMENKRQGPLTAIEAEKARLEQEKKTLISSEDLLLENLKNIPDLEKNLKQLQKEIQKSEADLTTRDDRSKKLEAARQEQADAKAENPRLLKEMNELKKRIQDLENVEGALCPLCGQELSLEERESLVETLKIEGKDLGDRYRMNQATLKNADQVVKDLQLQITELSLADGAIRKTQAEISQIEAQLKSLEVQQTRWEKEGQLELENLQKTIENENYAGEARAELKKINTELKQIGYDAAEHDRVREISSRGASVQERKSSLDKAEAALKPINREIADLTEQLSVARKESTRINKDLLESRQALESSRDKAPDTRSAQVDLREKKENEKILERDVGAAQQKVNVLDKQKKRVEELESSREDAARTVKQLRQLESAFGKDGVPALLIEQALPGIETKANLILDKLSGGGMSLKFITQREYKDAKRDDLRETLDIQIQDRAGVRDYELYSGGESFRINFAIRLALSHVLALRAGARLQTLVVDEGFGSQDAIGRQRLIEAINLVRNDFKKILVITHVEQIQEAFGTQLLVEKTPNGSQVTLV